MWLICTSCREDWLAQLIAELDDTDSYEYVKHLTDVHRLHLFDIVMQYRAIFFDSSMQVCVCVCVSRQCVSVSTSRRQHGSAAQIGFNVAKGLAGAVLGLQQHARMVLLQSSCCVDTWDTGCYCTCLVHLLTAEMNVDLSCPACTALHAHCLLLTPFQESTKPGSMSSSSSKDGSVLYTWVQHRIMHYLAALQRHLPRVEEGTNLAAVLEHSMYCCSSLSRVGLDFSALLQPLFQLCTLHLFSTKLAVAVDAFHQRLDSHKWVAMPTPMFHKAKQGEAAAAAGGQGGEAGAAAGSDKPGQQKQPQQQLTPPYELMEHVPLAVFTNGVLSALNELRHCALLPLQRPAGSLLQGALEQVASSMVHYRHTRSLADGEVPLFLAAARALSDVVVTYVAGCFGAIFPDGRQLLSAAAVTSILQDANA